ncbi:uncharacterized protein LOC126605933 [Malus sylvestris]|uniref:uncharacterized protein LOC126605933 n=1 Tax=Malus sylvestris TaxID=3752 RepID=UPI0021AC4E5C|nr:uncharacterized protein LOC126605933 [Malus sylvestris]
MDDFRSKSYDHGRTEVETNNGSSGASSGINGMQDLRCYSASYASSVHLQQQQQTQAGNNGEKFRKGKSVTKGWSLSDPELQRNKLYYR